MNVRASRPAAPLLLDHEQRVPVTSITGDLTDPKQVLAAFDGVTSVIHTAGLVSKATFQDSRALYRVNVLGEKHLSQQLRSRRQTVKIFKHVFFLRHKKRGSSVSLPQHRAPRFHEFPQRGHRMPTNHRRRRSASCPRHTAVWFIRQNETRSRGGCSKGEWKDVR